MEQHKPHILIGTSGSVATIKLNELVNQLSEFAEIKIISTNSALKFIDSNLTVLTDHDEEHWKKIGDPILHIDLRRWADLMIIAPLSANTLGKIVHGLADNLLTNVVRAWDFTKPLLVAPAMNTYMWEHPVTKPSIETLQKWGITILDPQVKQLACNDVGIGAMANVNEIVDAVHLICNKLKN